MTTSICWLCVVYRNTVQNATRKRLRRTKPKDRDRTSTTAASAPAAAPHKRTSDRTQPNTFHTRITCSVCMSGTPIVGKQARNLTAGRSSASACSPKSLGQRPLIEGVLVTRVEGDGRQVFPVCDRPVRFLREDLPGIDWICDRSAERRARTINRMFSPAKLSRGDVDYIAEQ